MVGDFGPQGTSGHVWRRDFDCRKWGAWRGGVLKAPSELRMPVNKLLCTGQLPQEIIQPKMSIVL